MSCRFRMIFVLIFAFMLCVAVRADSINNLQISIDSIASCPSSGCIKLFPQFPIAAIGLPGPSSGGTFQFPMTLGFVCCGPKGGLEIDSFLLVIAVTGTNVTCASNIFMNCSDSHRFQGTTLVSFSGGAIQSGEDFSFNFGCASGPCSWPANLHVDVYAKATTAPEPDTVVLLLTGIGATLSFKALRRT